MQAHIETARAVFRSHGAIVTLASGNAKTGRVAATYTSIRATCPDTCALRSEGTCYAQALSRYPWAQALEQNGDAGTANLAEAWGIEIAADGGHATGTMLRSGVSGDCTAPDSARRLGDAFRYWGSKGGSRVWKYTHAWRTVHRSEYGTFDGAILASLDHYSERSAAAAQGYRSFAVVVTAFPDGDRAFLLPDGSKAIPCPAQTGRAANCEACKLCTREGMTIAFEAHGSGAKRIARRIDGKLHLSVQ